MKLAIGCIIILIISLSFVQGANFPAPSNNPQTPQKTINSCESYNIPAGKTLCVEQTCPGGDQSKCYCSRMCGSSSPNSIGNIPNPQVISGGIFVSYDKQPSQKETDCKNSGCFLDKKCYPYGYIIDDKYCAEEFIVRFANGQERYAKKDIFANQSETGKKCNNNFECLTNSCLNGICINQSEEIEKRIEEEVSKEIDERKEEAFEKIEAQLEQLSYNKTYSLEVENTVIPVNKNIMEKVFNWFREILG